ncbi:tRNA ligase 1 [Morus notabilis]|uniref:tRNA ligase 1 n=1 Tax=Morus notabilis TaxID=981085 RepID=UPI000CED2C36|nr:tRNA ligase 1 [Morus notabilis]
MARNRVPIQGHIAMQKPESYGTVSGDAAVEVEETPVDKSAMLNQGNGVGQASASQKSSFCLSNLLESYTVDYSGYLQVKIRAAFYPKFENEKSDQEVSLKHSGPLFMYAGNGGAYAKKSFGNIYTAVGVFVLGRTLQEAWGAEAAKKQAEFDELLEHV